MKNFKSLLLSGASLGAMAILSSAYATGSALYETSSRGNAMGGALIGSTRDATAVYYNPANMGETTNVNVIVGATFIEPYCDVAVGGEPQNKMNGGWFTIPHAYVTMPLPAGFTLGVGEYSEYGVGTKYNKYWALANDSYETTVRQITVSPVLSYQATDKLSIAGGPRISWIEFESYNAPMMGPYRHYASIKGDDISAGYMLGIQYKITDTLRAGLVYRSPVHHRLHGDFNVKGPLATAGMVPGHSTASGKVELPQSVQLGLNWDITQKWRAGLGVTWTEWNALERLTLKMPGFTPMPVKDIYMNWHDVWRFSGGTEYDLCDWLSVRGSYQYDMDPSSERNGATMMSAGHRSLIGSGLGFKLPGDWTLDLGYTLIIQDAVTRKIADDSGTLMRFQTRNAFSHLVSASVGYSF